MASFDIKILSTLAVFLLLFVSSIFSQEFTRHPEGTIRAGPGEDAYLDCAVTNLNVGQYVAWYRGADTRLSQNDTVQDSAKYQIDVYQSTDNTLIYNLAILDVTTTDAGAYGCTIESSDHNIPRIWSTYAQLNVVSFPLAEYPACTPMDNFTVTEGETIMLECETEQGSPAVDIAWLRVGQSGAISGTIADVQGDKKYLRYTFDVSRADNEDAYKCRITSIINFPNQMPTCTSGPINVHYPPDNIAISQTTYEMNSTEDSYTAFRCDATGNPAASYTWTFSSPISNSSYIVTETGQLLVILETIVCDDQNIVATCEASNSIGTYSVNTTLCKVPTCNPAYVSFNKSEGESLTLSCRIDEIVDGINWHQTNLTNLTSDIAMELISTNDMSQLDYEFVVNRYDSETMYTCSVTQTSPPWEGLCQSGPLDNVYFPPDDVVIVPTSTIIDGATYESYWCTASGNPSDVLFTWTIAPSIDASMYLITDNGQHLVIRGNITCETFATLATCNASNDIGTHMADITLCRVPTCNPSTAITLREGQNQMLTCQHNVSPVDIYWEQDDVKITSNQTSTELDLNLFAHRNDTGSIYRCITTSYSQPSYEGACTSGPLIAQYPPEQIAIMPNQMNTTFYCSALGVPDITYTWSFNTSLTEGSHYSIDDNGQRLTLLDLTRCDTDIIATCNASNILDYIIYEVTICEGQPTTPIPYQTQTQTVAPKETPATTFVGLNAQWILIIVLCAFMATVIILALTICAARHNPLIKVEIKDRKDPEDPKVNVKPTNYKLSLAESEPSVEMGEVDHSNRAAKLSLATSETSNEMDMYIGMTTGLTDIPEKEETNNEDLTGQDNPGFVSFQGGNDSNEVKKADLLSYMTRPDSMAVDHAMTNGHVQESTIPNGSVENQQESPNVSVEEQIVPDGHVKESTIPNRSVESQQESLNDSVEAQSVPDGSGEETKIPEEHMVNGHVEESMDDNTPAGELVNRYTGEASMPAAETNNDQDDTIENVKDKEPAEETNMLNSPQDDIITPTTDDHDTPPPETQMDDDMFADVLNDIDGMLNNHGNGLRKDSDVLEL